MNRKELSEIRNHFGAEARYFTMDRVLTAFVDSERNVRAFKIRKYTELTGPESEIVFETMKKVLNCNLGKQSTEMAFKNHAYGEDGVQTFLARVLTSEFRDEELAQVYLDKLAKAVDSDESYAILAAYCQYDTPRKNKMDEEDGDSDTVFRYLLTALCPIAKVTSSLVYDTFDDAILRQENKNAVISKAPFTGFLYPVFTDRANDVHHVLYYTKTPNEPCTNLIEDFLECEPEATMIAEQTGMKQVLDTLLGDDLTYEAVATVNEKLNQIVAKNKTDEAPTELTGRILKRMLSEAGVPEEKLERTETVFESCVGNTTLKPERLVLPKTTIKTPEIVVNVKNEAKDKVHLETRDGRHVMVIDLDDAMIEVNGYDLRVPGMLEPEIIKPLEE